ncbi:MAG: CPBP family glutamic-type intramembrane protease, partial [Planctomycetota bacterium]
MQEPAMQAAANPPTTTPPTTSPSQWIATRPPLAKLALWAAAVVAIAAGVQAVAWLAGIDFSILDKKAGSGVLIGIGLALLLMLIAAEQRPMADYGMIADRDWRRRALRGLALGAGVYAAYLAIAWAVGVVELRPSEVSTSRVLKSLLAGFSAGPIAVTQQIIFSGYLLSTLRQKHSRSVSVLIPAVLFGLATGAAAPGGLAEPAGQRLFCGMLGVAVLLGLLRLRTGSIVFPA